MKDFVIPDDARVPTDTRDMGTPAVSAGAPVTLTVDGFAVTVPAGTSVMRAAAEAGIDIPKLCATDSMNAVTGNLCPTLWSCAPRPANRHDAD